MARPLIRKYETTEDELFKAYDILSKEHFNIVIYDGYMSVGCSGGLINMNEIKMEAWSSAYNILSDNHFKLKIDTQGMVVHCQDNLYIMNDEEEGFCIIHESDLEDFDERQLELDEELYGIDDEDNEL